MAQEPLILTEENVIAVLAEASFVVLHRSDRFGPALRSVFGAYACIYQVNLPVQQEALRRSCLVTMTTNDHTNKENALMRYRYIAAGCCTAT